MIILMGVAGAGKSVQGRLLADEAGYPWLSTGELLRVLITGKRRQEMLAGKLLDDEEVIKVVDTVINLIDPSQMFVLDGFPRSIRQSDWLIDQVKKGRFPLTAVFHLIAPQEVVESRLAKRGRADDSEQVLANRLKEFNSVTLPIIKHFEQENVRIDNIDATKDPLEVHKTIMEHLRHIESEQK